MARSRLTISISVVGQESGLMSRDRDDRKGQAKTEMTPGVAIAQRPADVAPDPLPPTPVLLSFQVYRWVLGYARD
jgi:hypothetical protein